MVSALDSALRQFGHEIYVLKTTAETGGDRPSGILPIPTVKRERIVGIVAPPTEERLAQLGIELAGDAILYCRKPIDIENNIEYDGVKYEIVREQKGKFYLTGMAYAYVLTRLPEIQTDTPGDGTPAPGFALVLELNDSIDIDDEFTSNMTADSIHLDLADSFTITDDIAVSASYHRSLGDQLVISDENDLNAGPGTVVIGES